MTLTKYEKENIILFNEGEDTAHIQTYNAGVGSVQQEAPRPLPLGKILRPRLIYVLDKSRLSIRL